MLAISIFNFYYDPSHSIKFKPNTIKKQYNTSSNTRFIAFIEYNYQNMKFNRKEKTFIMKKTYLWTAMLCTAIAFSACKSNKAGQDTASEAKTEEAVIPGSDKDEHGCVGSAGYVWSEVKKDCIRPFEAGLKISETQKDNATYATYIVFAADSVQAELYTPESEGSILLERADNQWKNDTISVSCKNGQWSISKQK